MDGVERRGEDVDLDGNSDSLFARFLPCYCSKRMLHGLNEKLDLAEIIQLICPFCQSPYTA